MAKFSIRSMFREIFGQGDSVRINRRGGVYVDGDLTGNVGGTVEKPVVVEVRVLEGTLHTLHCDMDVTVDKRVTLASAKAGMDLRCGPVQGSVRAGMEVEVHGDVGGNVESGMDVEVHGSVGGDVDAGMGVNIRKAK